MGRSSTQVAAATGCPLVNVFTYWPPLSRALELEGILSPATEIATIATVAVETGTFTPCVERGRPEYFLKYEPTTKLGQRLGNTQPGDGLRYRGRGFVQCTGRGNYREFGRKLGIPLEEHPELALEATTSARILARYFKDRKVAEAANAGDWAAVRRRVNGGYHGWTRFAGVVNALLGTPVLSLTSPQD